VLEEQKAEEEDSVAVTALAAQHSACTSTARTAQAFAPISPSPAIKYAASLTWAAAKPPSVHRTRQPPPPIHGWQSGVTCEIHGTCLLPLLSSKGVVMYETEPQRYLVQSYSYSVFIMRDEVKEGTELGVLAFWGKMVVHFSPCFHVILYQTKTKCGCHLFFLMKLKSHSFFR
jgi:hypothetical protein